MKFEWEIISDNSESEDEHWIGTERAQVPGGWLVKHEEYWDCEEETNPSYSRRTHSMVFVADPNHTWEITND